jgi:hypothetical protein
MKENKKRGEESKREVWGTQQSERGRMRRE